MRAIIVDDEPLARRGLNRLLSREQDVQVVGDCDSADSAIPLIERLRPDVVFLDTQLPGNESRTIVRAVKGDTGPRFVFVTAHAEHAGDALEIQAIDYLLKPIEAHHVARACQWVRNALGLHDVEETRVAAAGAAARTILTTPIRGRIGIQTEGRAVILKSSDIDWIEAAGNYVKVHAGESVFVVRETLNNLEIALQDEPFTRIHRSTLINLDSVRELQPWFSGEMLVIMKNGMKLKLSRTYRRVLERRVRILA